MSDDRKPSSALLPNRRLGLDWPEAEAMHAAQKGHADYCGIHYSNPMRPLCACTCGQPTTEGVT